MNVYFMLSNFLEPYLTANVPWMTCTLNGRSLVILSRKKTSLCSAAQILYK